MCIERIQRLLMAAMLVLAAALLLSGIGFGYAIIGFMVAMLLLWATTNFCPSLWIISKAGIKPCNF